MISRRLFLRNSAVAGAAAAIVTPPAIASGQPVTSKLTAIPTDVMDKIKDWQDACKAETTANNAYGAALSVRPVDKAECDRHWARLLQAYEKIGPARDTMLAALSEL